MSVRPSYARFYASKWRSGTLMLTLEEEGLYIRVSAFQMECGQPVPLDWKEGARLLCVQPLKYRKTIEALIAKGKLIRTQDGIICERAMMEFRRASKGVEGGKSDPPTNPRTNLDTNPDSNPVSMGVEAEIIEENQTQNLNRREEEEKKENTYHQASVEQDAEGLAGLNGMAVSMIGDVQRWMVGGDERSARTWLANTSRTFGAEITKRAYQKLGTDMAEGNPIARPLQTWGAIAQRMKAEAQSTQAKKSALSIIAEMEARGEF